RDLLIVKTYDEALALVRMGIGVAPAPEVFARRRLVTAFRIEPKEKYTRWIGIYHSARAEPRPEVKRLMAFVRGYFRNFEEELRLSKPVGLGHPGYTRLCEDFAKREPQHWPGADGTDGHRK